MRGWKDVLLIPGHMGSAKFVTKFEDFADSEIPFMYHCHMLVHEDEGMMGQFIVVEEDFDVPLIENSIYSFYPNPASDFITIDLVDNSDIALSLFDISGTEVYKQEIKNKSTEIDLTTLSAGIYFLKLGSKIEKFIKY